MWLKITNNYSPNFSLPKRSKKSIKFIILHYTGMKKESSAIKRLCDFSSKVSAHYFIKKNGDILNLVPDLYEAWHAGKSKWKTVKSLNRYSLGIEIQNSGHDNNYENFSYKQVTALIKILKILVKKYKIKNTNILGHSDISPNRKKDPGEKFPWKKLSNHKLVKWHNLNQIQLKKKRLKKLSLTEEHRFLKYLNIFGYNKIKLLKSNKDNEFLIKAFQRRFRQNLINGIADKECLLIVKNLIK
jgi:N-acetylmuramoyl-L-alanine amidase